MRCAAAAPPTSSPISASPIARRARGPWECATPPLPCVCSLVPPRREDFDDDEYEEAKAETLDQLKEFEQSLAKMVGRMGVAVRPVLTLRAGMQAGGDMSLVDSIGAMQLAIQAAVSSAFKTPEVIRMMGKREPGQLRSRIGELDAQVKIGKITEDQRLEQVVEILTAIRKLGGKISAEEAEMLATHGSAECVPLCRPSGPRQTTG